MSEKPAVLISEEQAALLKETAICKISFIELTGREYPWEVDHKNVQQIKAKLDHIENALRSANPVLDLTCVVTGDGAFWLPREGLDLFIESYQDKKKAIQRDGPYPIWKQTSEELLHSHINNMRQLILATAHDMVLLERLKDSLGHHHTLFYREFAQAERRVRILLDDIAEHGENFEFATSRDVVLLERVRVTQEMLNRGMAFEEDLGYSADELERVQQVLDKRCEKDHVRFRLRFNGIYNQLRESLRVGECSQLRRVSHWDMAFALIGTAPMGYRGQSQLARSEREILTELVASREEEIGGSDEGQGALTAAEETRQVVDPQSSSFEILNEESNEEESIEREIDEEEFAREESTDEKFNDVPSAAESQKSKKSVSRMAIINRIRR
jgi:hypothetical protein